MIWAILKIISLTDFIGAFLFLVMPGSLALRAPQTTPSFFLVGITLVPTILGVQDVCPHSLVQVHFGSKPVRLSERLLGQLLSLSRALLRYSLLDEDESVL